MHPLPRHGLVVLLALAIGGTSCASKSEESTCPGVCDFSTCRQGYHADSDSHHSCHAEDFVCCLAGTSLTE